MQNIQSPSLVRSELNIRQATPDDRAALETIAAQIWDGNDYLPRVLDSWLVESGQGFFVATLRDQVVGAIKLTRFAGGEWWMEGLRVDPAYQGQGVGRILHHFAVNQLRQQASGSVRFSTGSNNDAIHKFATETGFQRVASYVPLAAEALNEPVQRLRALESQDAAPVRAWLEASPHFAAAQRSIETDWTFYRLTDERLQQRLAEGLVYGWPQADDPDQLAGLMILNGPGDNRFGAEPVLKIGYLDAGQADVAPLARDARRLAAARNHLRLRFKALQSDRYLAALDVAGFAPEWDAFVWLYARDLRLTAHAEVRTEDLPPAQ